jgi:hypothetical protein
MSVTNQNVLNMKKFNYALVKNLLREKAKAFVAEKSLISSEEIKINLNFSEFETLLQNVLDETYKKDFSNFFYEKLTEITEGTTIITDSTNGKYECDYDPTFTKFEEGGSSVCRYMIVDILNELVFDFLPKNKRSNTYYL